MASPILRCLAITAALLTFGARVVTTAAATATTHTIAPAQIVRDVQALKALPSVSAGRPYLEGYDTAMQLQLEQAAGAREDGTTTWRAGRATWVRPGEGTFDLSITSHPAKGFSSTEGVEAVTLEVGGRWTVSWTTMCALMTEQGDGCPALPKGMPAGHILPTLQPPFPALTPGLANPKDLAMAPGGGVLIADLGRDQILKWDDGMLSVVAGDGLVGFSGDGGPATAAELNDPGQIAVGPNDTIYFVDQGNNRVRAISLTGVITTVAGNGQTPPGGGDVGDGDLATRVPLNPDGVAIGPTGTLWISSAGSIRKVAPDGIISTLVSGGPPYGVDLTPVNGPPTAFDPGELALNGQGQIVVFSFDTKALFVIDPDGTASMVPNFYANAISPGLDGSVLVADHQIALAKLTGTTSSTLMQFTRDQVPGLVSALFPEGVAEASDGTIYVDTQPGDGWTDQTGLYQITKGTVRPVAVQNSVASTLPAVGAPGFPATTYPAGQASTAVDAALPTCPSMHGVVPFDQKATAEARTLVGFWGTSLSYDLHASDRSAWMADLVAATVAGLGGRMTVGATEPAGHTLDAPALASACGQRLVDDSMVITMGHSAYYGGPPQQLFLLDRGGTPLVYFTEY